MFEDFDNMISEFMCDFGFQATYVQTISNSIDDATGIIVEVTENILVEAIKMELPRPTNGTGTRSNSLIMDGDQILYVRPTEKENEFTTAIAANPTQDKFVIKGVTWNIVTVKEYNPTASDCILYEFYIRK